MTTDIHFTYSSFVVPVVVMTLLAYLTLGPLFLIKKYNLKSQDEAAINPVGVQAYNTENSNEDLSNSFIHVFFCICVMIGFLLVVTTEFDQDFVISTVLGHVVIVFLFSFAIPTKIIVSNPKIRHSIKIF